MDAIGRRLDHRLSSSVNQECDDRAASASQLVAPTAAYWLDQAVGAKGPDTVAGLGGLQRHPVLFLVLDRTLARAATRPTSSGPVW